MITKRTDLENIKIVKATPRMIEAFFEKYPNSVSAQDYFSQIEDGTCIPLSRGNYPAESDGGWDIIKSYISDDDILKFLNEFVHYERRRMGR